MLHAGLWVWVHNSRFGAFFVSLDIRHIEPSQHELHPGSHRQASHRYGVSRCVWTKQRLALDDHTHTKVNWNFAGVLCISWLFVYEKYSIFETFLVGSAQGATVQAVLSPKEGYSFIKTNKSRWFKDALGVIIIVFWMIPSSLMYLDHIFPHIYK